MILKIFWLLQGFLLCGIGFFWTRDKVRTVNQLPGILMFLLALQNIFLVFPYLERFTLTRSELIAVSFFMGVSIIYEVSLVFIQIKQEKLMKDIVDNANKRR